MGDATTLRLDTADVAVGAGWHLESMRRFDEFSKDGVTILVEYAADDEIECLTRSQAGHADEVYGGDSAGKAERLRIWLGVRTASGAGTSVTGLPNIPFDQDQRGGCWTLETFFAAVNDPQDRAFLTTLLELLAANTQLPRKGSHAPLFFGVRPGGHMFVYPFGRRFPPFKFKVKQGRLQISGCWSEFDSIKGHRGFAEIATMLDLNETGPASSVPVEGLDADALWAAGEKVSDAINA